MIKDCKSPAGIKGGDEVAAFLIANEKSLGVEYIIWRDKIWVGSTTGWKNYSTGGYGGMYTGNWNDTTLHNDHVHLTVYGKQGHRRGLKVRIPRRRIQRVCQRKRQCGNRHRSRKRR